MAEMGKYCKAYGLKELRRFGGWRENTANARREVVVVDDQEVEQPRTLADEDFLYLQENYVVTDGVFKDENIIFDDVTSAWQTFCHEMLGFEIPSW